MGVGIKGPIGWNNIIAFSVSSTFRIPIDPRINKQEIKCKICGNYAAKGKGNEIYRVGSSRLNLSSYFLCAECYATIKKFIEADGRFTKNVTKGD